MAAQRLAPRDMRYVTCDLRPSRHDACHDWLSGSPHQSPSCHTLQHGVFLMQALYPPLICDTT